MKREREEAVTLEILQAIDARSDVTQRHLADHLGVALGLANSYLRRCVRKGLVKITQAPANRYLYYLTPRGFAEKSRLTAEYLTSSFEFYRKASASMTACLSQCETNSWPRILFAGVSELAEIGSVRAHDFDVEVLGTVDPYSGLTAFLGKPVWQGFEQAVATDAVIFTALVQSEAVYDLLRGRFEPSRVIVPDIVRPLAIKTQSGA